MELLGDALATRNGSRSSVMIDRMHEVFAWKA
jgi:hypothetical protein